LDQYLASLGVITSSVTHVQWGLKNKYDFV
jgi:hypothetical protein